MKFIAYLVVRGMVWVILRSIFTVMRVRIENRSHVPRRGGLIVTPNHLSFIDPLLVMAYMYRYNYAMATDELFAMKGLAPLVRLLRTYPVKQDSPDRKALRFTEDLLKTGECVLIFPEGHVSPEGKMLPLQPGVVLLAMRSKAAVLPVGLINSQEVMAYKTYKLKMPKKQVTVRYGKPISIEELTGGREGREGLEYGVTYLAKAIAALSGQEVAEASGSDPSQKITPDSIPTS